MFFVCRKWFFYIVELDMYVRFDCYMEGGDLVD